MGSFKEDRHMEFSRSIIEGVEIKLCRNDPHAYKHHVHNELSLGYIVEGSTDLTLNDRTIHYQSGDGVIIPPLMTHRCAPNDINHWVYIMLFIDPGYYGDLVSFRQAKKLIGYQELLLEFGDDENSEVIAANASDSINMIHDYILNHGKDNITLDQLQQISGLNKFSIIRNFKKLYTTTPSAYHLQYRVAEAKRLLGKGADVFDICDRGRI